MSKTAIAVTALVAGGVSYWLGVSQSQEAEPLTPSNFNSGAVESAESGVMQQALSQRQTVKSDAKIADSSREKAEQESSNSTEELIGKHPFHFRGIYAQVARENSYYPKIVDLFVNENGVSSWGTSREGEITNFMQFDALKNINVDYLQCRIKTCLMRGSAESLDAASQVYKHYIKIQQWGHHFDGKEDEDGNFHFYIITHRQDD